jgi:hypothetical protein
LKAFNRYQFRPDLTELLRGSSEGTDKSGAADEDHRFAVPDKSLAVPLRLSALSETMFPGASHQAMNSMATNINAFPGQLPILACKS